MNNWKRAKLIEIAETKRGISYGIVQPGTFQKTGGVPVLKVNNLTEGKVTINDVDKVSENIEAKHSRTRLQGNEILISIVGSLGHLFKPTREHIGWNVVRAIAVLPIRPEISRDWVYYCLRNPVTQNELIQRAMHTVQATLNLKELKEISIPLPDIKTQLAISEILLSIDDKIELNTQINKELELLAKSLFHKWFVDFEFPNENGLPYKSTNGEFSKTEIGLIPKGWSVKPLPQVFDFLEGPGLRNWQYRDEGMPFINIRLIQNGDLKVKNASCISVQEFNSKYSHFKLDQYDYVVSTSGTLGKSAIVRKSHLPLMLNTSVIRFKPLIPYSRGFMYQYLQSDSFITELTTQASGSVQLNFGPMHLRRINIILPEQKLLEKYESAISKVYEKILSNREENDDLAKLRDTLLPRLISGQTEMEALI